MSSKIYTGMNVCHHRRRCYGMVLYEVTSDSHEYMRGRTKSGRQWKVLWTDLTSLDRHSERISVHQERNLSQSTPQAMEPK